MSTLEKQMDLMRIIPDIEDEAMLDAIYLLITGNEADIIQFTKEEEEQVLRGHQQYKDGNFKTTEEIEQKLNQWLEE